MSELKKLFNDNNIDPFVQDILTSQNLSTAEISQIINDEKYPFKSEYLDVILDRIYKAKVLSEKVVIVGDYDADGIMATTILHKALTDFGIEAGFYIPNRLSEGYGINDKIIDKVASKGYSLIITVDNGVVAYSALDHAKSVGIDVIVTDHHMLDEQLNYNFDYLLHPKLLPNGYNDLCGAGLSLIIAERIISKEKLGELYVYAMVATIADMVSVFGFNRNIIKNGLYYLNKNGNEHIENLIHYRNGKIDQKVISFQVVPKLNTFGRMADIVNVNNIVRYFLLNDSAEIEAVAKSITKVNQDRIDLTRKTFEEHTDVKKYGTLNVLIGENIHEGITGLIAGRNLSLNNEPIIVLTKVNDVYKGSGRSPVGYDLHKLLNPLSEYFESFGGHAQACGISIAEHNLATVLGLLSENSQHIKYDVVEKPYLNLDINNLSITMIEQINNLEPYGVDFIKPLFKVNVDNLKTPTVLKEKYLKWSLSDNIEMLCFDSSMDLDLYKSKTSLSAYVDVSLNTFRNKTTMNLIIDYNNKV